MTSLGVVLICQNATMRVWGAWIILYYILCLKTYTNFGGLFWPPAGWWRTARGAHLCEINLFCGMSHG